MFLDKCQGVADIYFLSYIWEPKPFCGNDAEFIVVLEIMNKWFSQVQLGDQVFK